MTPELVAEVARLVPDADSIRSLSDAALVALCVGLREQGGRDLDEGALVELAFHKFPSRFSFGPRPEFPDTTRIHRGIQDAQRDDLLNSDLTLTENGRKRTAEWGDQLRLGLDRSTAHASGDLKFAARIEQSPGYIAFADSGTLVRTKPDELFRMLRVPPTTDPSQWRTCCERDSVRSGASIKPRSGRTCSRLPAGTTPTSLHCLTPRPPILLRPRFPHMSEPAATDYQPLEFAERYYIQTAKNAIESLTHIVEEIGSNEDEAITRRAVRDGDDDQGWLRFAYDPATMVLELTGDGVGMTADAMRERLGRVGESPDSKSKRSFFHRGVREVFLAMGGGEVMSIGQLASGEHVLSQAVFDPIKGMALVEQDRPVTDQDRDRLGLTGTGTRVRVPVRRFALKETKAVRVCGDRIADPRLRRVAGRADGS